MIRKVIWTFVMVSFIFLLTSCNFGQIEVDYVQLDCTPDLFVGQYGEYYIVIEPQDADNLGYSLQIDDPGIVNFTTTLEFSGNIEGISVGTTWIHVYTDDGGHHDSCQVIVSP